LQHLQLVAQRIKEQHGDLHPAYATALNNLAGVYQSLGDFSRATAHLKQAVAIRQKSLGDNHEDTITALNNLAGLNLLTGESAEARRIFADVADTRRKALGDEHPDYATSLNNLAAAEEALHQADDAERHYREALRIRERVLGPRHPDVAASLNNLAALLRARGHNAEAETDLRRALEIREQALGRWHLDYAASLNNLAVHFRECGDHRKAARWYRQALALQQQFIDATLPALAEQQQITLLAALRRTLDGFLSVVQQADVPVEEAYGHVLWWKGRVLVRQLGRRHAAAGNTDDPRLNKLRALSSQLAALAFTASRIWSNSASNWRQTWLRHRASPRPVKPNHRVNWPPRSQKESCLSISLNTIARRRTKPRPKPTSSREQNLWPMSVVATSRSSGLTWGRLPKFAI
jgi:tetratricopeptide (TPR) repeat protein